MSFTNADLQSALDKMNSIEFTEAEAAALSDYVTNDDVGGFNQLKPLGGMGFLLEVSGLKLGDPTGGNAKLGPGQNETFTATDDLARVTGKP